MGYISNQIERDKNIIVSLTQKDSAPAASAPDTQAKPKISIVGVIVVTGGVYGIYRLFKWAYSYFQKGSKSKRV